LDLKSNWYLNASAGSSPARGTSLHLFSGEGFFYAHNFCKYTGVSHSPTPGGSLS